jgi:hypothetical protein
MVVLICLDDVSPLARKVYEELQQHVEDKDLAIALENCSIERMVAREQWRSWGIREFEEDCMTLARDYKLLASRVRVELGQ